MPILPVDALGVGFGMDWQDLGMPFGAGRVGVNMQFTEISAEPLVGFHIQRLIAKEQNLMLRQRLMQLLDLRLLSGFDSTIPSTFAPMRGVTGVTLMDS